MSSDQPYATPTESTTPCSVSLSSKSSPTAFGTSVDAWENTAAQPVPPPSPSNAPLDPNRTEFLKDLEKLIRHYLKLQKRKPQKDESELERGRVLALAKLVKGASSLFQALLQSLSVKATPKSVDPRLVRLSGGPAGDHIFLLAARHSSCQAAKPLMQALGEHLLTHLALMSAYRDLCDEAQVAPTLFPPEP